MRTVCAKSPFIPAANATRFRPMDAVQQEVTDIFIRTKALLQGHFVLRSGLHSGHFFQCAQVCQDMPAVERLRPLPKQKLGALALDTLLSPPIGGPAHRHGGARQAKTPFHLFEKRSNSRSLPRRLP